MKKTKIRAACLLMALLAVAFAVPIQAKNAEYSWYCAHVKGHAQPNLASELQFIEALGGHYVDRDHSDPNAADRVIYLTFDAGYENGNVARVLDVLREEEVPGTFFILGHLITSEPELVKRMAAEGHTVGNHTVNHGNMSQRGEKEILEELFHLETMYRDLTGVEMSRYYRPPEGRFSKENLEVLQKNGYQTLFWSFAYPDWDNQKQMDRQKAKRIIMENLHNGEVMLLHPTSSVNAEILGEVVREAKAQGYRFASPEEWLGDSHAMG